MICTENVAKGVVPKEQLQITFQNKPSRTGTLPMAPYDMCLRSPAMAEKLNNAP